MITEQNASLRRFNTFGLDVHADLLIEYDSVNELRRLVTTGLLGGRHLIQVGRGSNLLFVNEKFDGTVLHSGIGGIQRIDDTTIKVGAGVVFDDLVAATIDMGLYGLENLSYIPGETGSAAVQNIGAYGVEIADRIVAVDTVDLTDGSLRRFNRDELAYGYRDSLFKHPGYRHFAVTSVTLQLDREFHPVLTYKGLAEAVDPKSTPLHIRESVIAMRRAKLPDPAEIGSAGSFFKNPVVDGDTAARMAAENPGMPQFPADNGHVKLSAGWMIEKTGWKGRSLGNAGVYSRQALVLVNNGGAKGSEIARLAAIVADDVEARFGVRLSPEVNFI